MAKAILSKSENVEFRAELRALGECLDEARNALGWTVDRLAQELKRNRQQVGRWITGDERTQVDVVWSVPVLRGPFVIALAKRAPECCQVETTVRIRVAI